MPLTQPLNIDQSELVKQHELIARLARGVEMAQTVSVGPADLEALFGLESLLDCIADQIADQVDVVFLRDEAVFAVFPGLAHDAVCVVCYHSIGQHSACDLGYCDDCDEVTNPAEYADLKEELECIGYVLNVIEKDCLRWGMYADQRRAQLAAR